jgi:hypothetical protein
MKKIFILSFVLSFLLMSPSLFSQEILTISTYYPSPFGIYNRLVTTTLGVGDNNTAVAGIDASDAPDPTTNAGDAWIAGDMGIGTSNPQADLEVNNTLRLRPTNSPNHNAEGSLYYDDSDDILAVNTTGTASGWKRVGGGGYCYARATEGAVSTCPPGWTKPDLGGAEELGDVRYCAWAGCLGGQIRPVGFPCAEACNIVMGKYALCCHD